MSDSVVFTDRYGGRAPSWLRGCHGDCEAMGCYPVQDAIPGVRGYAFAHSAPTEYEAAEISRQRAERGPSEDGWYFVRCPDCNGKGRCSWYVTVTRIPAWFKRGARSFRELGPRSSMWQGHPFGYWRRTWVAFKVAFLCDLGVSP